MEQLLHPSKDGSEKSSAALMGAMAGAAAVWAMDRVDWFMWDHEDPRARAQTTRVRPGGEPPSHTLVSKIENSTGWHPTARQHDIAGNITHYSIGIAPAAGYALVRDKLPGQGVPRGMLFGLSLFLVQDETLNSLSGLGAKPSAYPWQAHARGLIAHVVYGVATELILNALGHAAKSVRTGSLQGQSGTAASVTR